MRSVKSFLVILQNLLVVLHELLDFIEGFVNVLSFQWVEVGFVFVLLLGHLADLFHFHFLELFLVHSEVSEGSAIVEIVHHVDDGVSNDGTVLSSN